MVGSSTFLAFRHLQTAIAIPTRPETKIIPPTNDQPSNPCFGRDTSIFSVEDTDAAASDVVELIVVVIVVVVVAARGVVDVVGIGDIIVVVVLYSAELEVVLVEGEEKEIVVSVSVSVLDGVGVPGRVPFCAHT